MQQEFQDPVIEEKSFKNKGQEPKLQINLKTGSPSTLVLKEIEIDRIE